MTNWDRQHRPISTSETATDDGLSIRGVRDLSESLNNYGRHFCPKFISEMCIPPWESADSSNTNENVIAVWAPFFCPDGPNSLRVTIGCKRIAGAGVVTIKMYLSTFMYYGDKIMDTGKISPFNGSCSFTCDSDAYEIHTDTIPIPHEPGAKRTCWILITMQNESGSRAQVATVDATPKST